MINLSLRAQYLWGKTSGGRFFRSGSEGDWLPLYVHFADAAEIAAKLWDEWMPNSVKDIIVRGFLRNGVTESPSLDQDFASQKISASAASNHSLSDHYEQARKLFVFLAAAHDLGKASPAFQMSVCGADKELLTRLIDEGLPMPKMSDKKTYKPHAFVSQLILERNEVDTSYAVILGGHHGKPPQFADFREYMGHEAELGFDNDAWVKVQDELFYYALSLSGLSAAPQGKINMHAQVVLSGLVIMADWLASDSRKFSLFSDYKLQKISSSRVENAWEEFDLPPHWKPQLGGSIKDMFRRRFAASFSPRRLQIKVAEAIDACRDPGILVVEGPMGVGKTEAALVAAEIMAGKTGCGGVFFGLPTMATSDGMFERILHWVNRIAEDDEYPQSIFLAHGKAHLNEAFTGIGITNENVGDEGEDNVTVNDWMRGRKKGILANVVVGTVDQLLFMALKMKHLAVRHLALASKVIIIDECHAYDAYMNGYLMRALTWLGKYKTPVILLSATLPINTRRQLIEAYLGTDFSCDATTVCNSSVDVSSNGVQEDGQIESNWITNTDYPVITYTDGKNVRQTPIEHTLGSLSVKIEYLDDDRVVEMLDELLTDGGCAGIICNTVGRAQEMYELLKSHFGAFCVVCENDESSKQESIEMPLQLFHSRFLSLERAEGERNLRQWLGVDATLENGKRPKKMIVVGTQVLEQSLDIDFDLLISDIAPMDLLIQRIGRLHRHHRAMRPGKLNTAKCFIIGVKSRENMLFEDAITEIYPQYLLMNTVHLLPDSVLLPDDISPLVQNTYDDSGVDIDERLFDQYAIARGDYDRIISQKEERANDFQIGDPSKVAIKNMVNWIDIERNDGKNNEAEASVRDTEDSLEVIVLMRDQENRLRLLPEIERIAGIGDYELSRDYAPNDAVAKILASCTIRLPFRKDWQISKVIKELEQELREWQQSYWLRGELFLILDANMRCELAGYEVEYSGDRGLRLYWKRGKDE
jgi:CRISPR-associated endonuclease/helicase Cas3